MPEQNPWNSWMRFVAFDFFSDGRAAISTWSGDVWIVSGIDDKLGKLTWKRYAAGLFEGLGLRIVNDEVYVNARDRIVRRPSARASSVRDRNGRSPTGPASNVHVRSGRDSNARARNAPHITMTAATRPAP